MGNRKSRRSSSGRVVFFGLLFVCVASLYGQDTWTPRIRAAINAGDLRSIYLQSTPSTRLAVLRELARVVTCGQYNSSAVDILGLGLHDSIADIVKESIVQVGLLRAGSFSDTLVNMFKNAGELFGGAAETNYKRRIIDALSMIGGSKTQELFAAHLHTGDVSVSTDRMLLAIRSMGDTTYLPIVDAYCSKLQAFLSHREDTPENGIRFARDRQCLTLANEVRQALRAKGELK